MPPPPFNALRPYLLERFGREVFRVALDAGSTCPNRDGSKGFGGCVYCDVEGSGTGELRTGKDLDEQLERGIRRVLRRGENPGVIAYLQSYSNTYVGAERLAAVLEVVEPFLASRIVAVSVATRPDTLPPESLEILARLSERVPVWLELGLETADDAILEDIHRYHTVADFKDAVARTHAAGLEVVGHAILGLPGDGRDGARRTAELLAETGVAGVKVHNLVILRQTVLEHWQASGRITPLDADSYVLWLADFIERLHPDQILHRITADAPAEKRATPPWPVHKNDIRDLVIAELARRGTRQGAFHVAL